MRFIVIVAALCLAVFPSAALAQSTYERCAVGIRYEYGYGPASVIRMYGSINYQPDVQMDAAVCSDLISAGWNGVSKYGEWERRNGGSFRPVCGYGWPTGETVSVYTLPGNEAYGYTDCLGFSGGVYQDLTWQW